MKRINIITPIYNEDDFKNSYSKKSVNILKNQIIEKYDIQHYTVKGTAIHENRNGAIRFCGIRPNEYFLFLDSDINFKEYDLDLLIDSGYDCITGLYLGKEKIDKHEYRAVLNDRFLTLDDDINEIMQIERCGAGFFLVTSESLAKVRPNWFLFRTQIRNGIEISIGEDFVFCDKLHEAGYKIYVHNKCIVKHNEA